MGRGADPKISIVIPARNEARNLEVVLPELPEGAEIVLVDGHSVDGTVEVVRRLRPSAVTISQTRTGKGNALACGFEAASGDVIVMFDADGSADPAEIPAFVETLTRGADFAKGTRYREPGGSDDITVLRRLGNAALNRLANTLYDTAFSDLCYGYNAFWRDIVPQLELPPAHARSGRKRWGDGFEIETVLSCRVVAAGLKAVEVPSFERQRLFGETNLRTFSDGARVLRTIFAEYRRYRARRRPGLAGSGDLAAQELA
ncbi:glycosyltransferase family 2 protein [Amycolatopsis orientalis]|uniref:glycosyltransferase family 2 protein n=1 Tax=Amycolatopsis orientalis TaxID=31958 RepID=UPI0003A6361C|nr:glycosyltransferase family 2 protein [Amycolatopsis orientalis]